MSSSIGYGYFDGGSAELALNEAYVCLVRTYHKTLLRPVRFDSGDTGAIGRISVPSKKRRGKPLTFDLKGGEHVYGGDAHSAHRLYKSTPRLRRTGWQAVRCPPFYLACALHLPVKDSGQRNAETVPLVGSCPSTVAFPTIRTRT